MKTKRLIAIFVLIATVATLGLCLSGCKKEENKTARIDYNYVLTDQFTRIANFTQGSLLIKPQDPIFENQTFNAGYAMAQAGNVTITDFPMQNPRMINGYDVNTNYYFVGWYKEPEYISLWNFAEDRIYVDTILYAKWIIKTW